MSLFRRLVPDRFIMVILGTILVASLLPATGQGAEIAGVMSSVAIFTLFFLHGLRLPRAEVLTAVRNWRLQLIMFLFVFAAMPLASSLAAPVASTFLPAGLVTGVVFLGLLPTTVQSSISYSSIAGGNVAASVMASALLNLSGIFMTPLLTAFIIGAAGGGGFSWNIAIKVMTILLLPFAIGQFAQKWLGAWALRRKALLSIMDKSAIAIAVYVAFSSAVAGGLWQMVDILSMLELIALVAALLAFGFAGPWLIGNALALPRADRISLVFAGSHKSIATGAPLAAILFAGPQAGMVILPALIYHQLQLIVSAPLAKRLATSTEPVRAA